MCPLFCAVSAGTRFGSRVLARLFVFVRIIGLAGWSGAGKTTLLAGLIPCLVAGGLTVSTIKHAHHRFDVALPGDDSFAYRQAGAEEVLVSSGQRFALMHELRADPEYTLVELLTVMTPVDLVIVEGFKAGHHPKIEVHRTANGKQLMFPGDGSIIAIASDNSVVTDLPAFDLNDFEAIAAFVRKSAVPFCNPA